MPYLFLIYYFRRYFPFKVLVSIDSDAEKESNYIVGEERQFCLCVTHVTPELSSMIVAVIVNPGCKYIIP